ncbi:MAG TPA: DNA polymerase III subunit alpha [bacterium]|nr:DNA polymerase III subunit alpha [bacterium]
MTARFVHLHVHSEYSLMRGVNTVDALCAAARAQGSDAIALTDTNGMYGAIRFIGAARRTGLRPILGAEVVHGDQRAVLLVKNPEGYANLCRILSRRHCDPAFDLIRAGRELRAGVVLVTDNPAALAVWQQESSDDLFVELTPGPQCLAAGSLCAELGLPPVATNRVHFIDGHEFAVHQLLRAIALNTVLSRLPDAECAAPTHRLASPAEMAAAFPHLPEAVANTTRIADQCGSDWSFSSTIFPRFENWTDLQAMEELRRRTYQGAERRYGTVTSEVGDRIEHELSIIAGKQFAHIFLVVEQVVHQSPLTCGRGSAAASIVSYCLGLTHVDPIKHHLYFERFLNPGRADPPDIDIDFPWDERDGLLDWVLQHYGDRAAMVATHQTMTMRGALREVATIYGMPPAEVERVAPIIARHAEISELAEDTGARAWAEALCRRFRLAAPWPEILGRAALLQGHVRRTAVHCGGIVIVPAEIRRHVPVEVAAKGVPIVQWEKDQSEAAGLVKIDLLGNRSLSVIRDTLQTVRRNTGRDIDYATWDPILDEATCELIRRGDTMGCFYVESPATRLLLKKLWTRMPADRRSGADVFEYLVIVSSLVRPAAISFVNELVRRAHGASYVPLHPLLSEVLADTHGIMVYQEDVTRVAIALAGFSVEEADELRKAISKKASGRRLAAFCARFTSGATSRGVAAPVIDAVWAMIMSFAGYSFCKPHSASYAQVSFKSAYLRAHFPAEFMAAVITNQGGYYSTYAYLSEARRMGLRILPPDINVSAIGYTGNGRCLRVGLMQIAHLTAALTTRIIAERQAAGPFISFGDFIRRVQPAPTQARWLIKSGCCDSIAGGLSRPALLWRLLTGSRDGDRAAIPAPDEYDDRTRARHEVETLGFPIARHPLDLYATAVGKTQCVQAAELDQWRGRDVAMLGWLLTEKLTQTKRGEPMEFVTFEDSTGMYETSIFPDVFRKYAMLLAPNQPYLLHGRIEEEFGAATLRVRELQRLT